MPARPVNMAVGEFILGGFPYVDNVHIEIKRDSSQRMICINADRVALYADDCDDLRLSLRALGAELHAGLDVLDALKCLAGDFLDELVVALAVGLLGLN